MIVRKGPSLKWYQMPEGWHIRHGNASYDHHGYPHDGSGFFTLSIDGVRVANRYEADKSYHILTQDPAVADRLIERIEAVVVEQEKYDAAERQKMRDADRKRDAEALRAAEDVLGRRLT